MKIVIFGKGLIGSQVATKLEESGHDVVALGRESGIDTTTGTGLRQAMEGADVVIDLTNSPSWADDDVMAFFRDSTAHLLAAEEAAGVGHHVILSIVGADRVPDSGYMRAKVAQEELVKAGRVPYSIVRSTQFFEFIASLAEAGVADGTVRLSNVLMQPIAAEDIAGAVAKVALQAPKNGYINVAGPERRRQDELARELLKAKNDPRQVVTDPSLGYFGGQVPENALVPDHDEVLGTVRFSDWLAHSQAETHQTR